MGNLAGEHDSQPKGCFWWRREQKLVYRKIYRKRRWRGSSGEEEVEEAIRSCRRYRRPMLILG
jgi:hypothetical protein